MLCCMEGTDCTGLGHAAPYMGLTYSFHVYEPQPHTGTLSGSTEVSDSPVCGTSLEL